MSPSVLSFERFDLVVLGGGPAGQKAAIQGVKAGRRVALVERERGLGGACVHRGTIPSKTLRDTALRLANARLPGDVIEVRLRSDVEVTHLVNRLDRVVRAHVSYMEEQVSRNGVVAIHGKARFVSPTEVVVRGVDGSERGLSAEYFVVATGSRPRTPPEIPVDHEHILDSDSILSMIYLPRSLAVLGGGVIACEYASIFAELGVEVTMIDRAERPLMFMDAEIVAGFVSAFTSHRGRYVGSSQIMSVAWDGLAEVETVLGSGETLRTDKVLVALGRAANVEDLQLDRVGIVANARGVIDVDEHCRTKLENIYAVGDVIGPPALASTSMEQGRRAVCHALGLDPCVAKETTPIGIYTIPELASVGLDEVEAQRRHGAVIVGRARFSEIARGQISGCVNGFLKLVADGEGRYLLGAQVVGEGATELVHLAQMALISGWEIDAFVENIFNFPTLAEAYRVAALDVVGKRLVTAGRVRPTVSVASSVLH
jgi:NAD(P) transhydrogenase